MQNSPENAKVIPEAGAYMHEALLSGYQEVKVEDLNDDEIELITELYRAEVLLPTGQLIPILMWMRQYRVEEEMQ